jgi:hypothetical protein
MNKRAAGLSKYIMEIFLWELNFISKYKANDCRNSNEVTTKVLVCLITWMATKPDMMKKINTFISKYY